MNRVGRRRCEGGEEVGRGEVRVCVCVCECVWGMSG